MKLALAQCNTAVGDFDGNLALCRAAMARAQAEGAGLLIFPEMMLCGYPPEDLLLRPDFIRRCMEAAERLARETGEMALLVGGVWEDASGLAQNVAILMQKGRVVQRIAKQALPNYGVFDEKRVFHAGVGAQCVELGGLRLGVLVCEDSWDSAARLALQQLEPQAVLVLNASPFTLGKPELRHELMAGLAQQNNAPVVYLNAVGGQDELVFDGQSFALNAAGEVALQMAAFAEDFAVMELSALLPALPHSAAFLPDYESVYAALVLGLRDYVGKSGFSQLLLGFSGGVDSALSAAIAADAIGAENVLGVMLPSPFTSQQSLSDAAECARRIGIELQNLSIIPAMRAVAEGLEPSFGGTEPGLAEENIQARLRGVMLMALSNKSGRMLLTTGNKSEMAVGYATLYGDMCGGFSVLKDVYKTTVYALCYYRNAAVPAGSRNAVLDVVPDSVLLKAPTAELRPNQKDEDSLPPYDVLDDILELLVEGAMGVEEIIERGYAEATVRKVAGLLKGSEYKRRQAAPGVKVSTRGFGRDWRYPLVNGFGF